MGFTCSLCQDRGVIVNGDVAVPCNCSRQRALANRFRESRLPPRMRSYTFDSFNLKYYSRQLMDPVKKISLYESANLALKAAREFVRDFSQRPNTDGLLFTGPVGSGKTYLACCIANALLQQGQVVLFVVVPDLLDRIRSTYDASRQGNITEQELLDTAREVPLLILDDLGAHNYTDWTRNKLYSILNYRLNHELPVIITTNISLEDLEEYLGERTTSRILQMCRPYRLMVDMDIRVVQRRERS